MQQHKPQPQGGTEASPLLLLKQQQHPQRQDHAGSKNATTTKTVVSPSGSARSSIVYASSTFGSPCNSHSSRGQRRRRNRSSNTSSATTIPTSLRWMTNASSLLSALLFTGIIFGWAALKLILIREGQYQELCVFDSSDSSNSKTSTTAAVQDDTVGNNKIPCVQQLDRFNRIFTLAQFALSFCSLPVGFFLDHTPSITFHYAIAAVFEASGLILFGLSESSSISSFVTKGGIQVGDYFCLAYSCMAIGGCMTMLGAFPASFLLPRHQPAILASISCLFDASSVVFAIFNRLNIMNLPFLFSRRGLFMAYAIVALFIYSLLSYCWASIEKHDWKSIVEAEQSCHQTASSIASTSRVKDSSTLKQQQEEQVFVESANHHHQDPNGAAKGSGASGDDKAGNDSDDSHLLHCRRRGMHEWSLSQQWQTLEFVLVLVFASVHMLRCNFYIETVNEILASIAAVTVAKSDGGGGVDDDDAAVVYANIFSFVLPVGIIFVPLIETTVRRLGIVQTLHLTNVLGIVFGALLLVPSLHVQAFNFFVFTCFRAYLYATLNTFIALTFGVSTMGRMIGSTFTTAAIVTLLQYPAASMAQGRFHNDYTVTNLIMLSSCALPTGLAILYSLRGRKQD